MLHHSPRPLEDPTRVKTLLLLEDDVNIAETLVLAVISETPHQVLVETSAANALHLLLSIQPDLILLDYHLSGMNGVAFYDHLRSLPGQAETPVVFMSADSTPHVVQNIKERNAILLAKPFDLDEFFALIKQVGL